MELPILSPLSAGIKPESRTGSAADKAVELSPEPAPIHAANSSVVYTPQGLDNDESATDTNPEASTEQHENPDRPKGFRFAILMACILLGDFVTGYDNSCVATLTPVISDRFHAVSDIGWYGIAYLLASCATTLSFGQIYSFFSMKQVFLISCLIFTVGSLITATAASSQAFIVGRGITGLGSSGMFAGGNIIVAGTTSLKHRPIYQAIAGGVECIALAFGPVISGAISHNSSWRAAFYMTIPIGVAMIVAVFFFIHRLERPEHADLRLVEKIQKLDLFGFAIYVPMAICLTLGLQWGGTDYAWDSWRTILLMALAGFLLVMFIATEYKIGEVGMFPLKMFRQRSVALSCLFTFSNSATQTLLAYYIPVYFQAVKGASTGGSGLMYLPLAAATSVAVLAAGPLTSFVGYYNFPMIIGCVLQLVASGLITTFAPNTPADKWISYQILYGIGVGLAFQQPYIAVQTIVTDKLVPTALVTLAFAQQFGSIVALSIAQNIFLSGLSTQLAKVPGLTHESILQGGALGVIEQIPAQYHAEGIAAYNTVLTDVFYIGLAYNCVTLLAGVGIEWRSVKQKKQ